MTYDPEKYERGRRAANERSRNWATNHGLEWDADEDALLWDEWINLDPADRDEEGVAFVLERTIEACRNRAHFLLCGPEERRGVIKRTTTRRTVTETTTEYIGAMDDPEDRWWDPTSY